MVLNIPEIKTKYKQCGGIYVISTEEMKAKKVFKVGMSHSNMYRRLDSYQLVLPWGYDINMLLLMRNKTKKEKDDIRKCEKWIHSQLNSAKLTTRIFKDRIEIFENTYKDIFEVLLKAQERFVTLGFFNNLDKIETDDKCYEVKKVLGEKMDELGRTQYEILWGDNSKTYEFKSALQGTDHQGDWIVAAYSKYLKTKKAKPVH